MAYERYVQPLDENAAALAEQTRRIAYPAGGMIASAADLLHFGVAFLDGAAPNRFLSSELRHLMATPATVGIPGRREPDHAGTTTERGLGWAIGGPGTQRTQSVLWHGGVSGASLWVDRDQRLVLVFLTARWFLPRSFFASLVDGILGAFDPLADR